MDMHPRPCWSELGPEIMPKDLPIPPPPPIWTPSDTGPTCEDLQDAPDLSLDAEDIGADTDDWSNRPTRNRSSGGADLLPVPDPVPHIDHPDITEERTALAHFHVELQRGMPNGYLFNPETRTIMFSRGKGVLVCGPMRIVSHPRRADHSGFMLEAEFLDCDDRRHRIPFTRTDVMERPGRVFSVLIDRGFEVHADRREVMAFMKSWRDVEVTHRTDASGWVAAPDAGLRFVRPDGSVHGAPRPRTPEVVLSEPHPGAVSRRGSFAAWHDGVARPATGNALMILAISTALAGPLLRFAGLDTVAINLFGPAHLDAAFLLRLAAGCGSDPGSTVPWSSAQTGLHGFSTRTQDGLLALQGFPRDPGARLINAVLALPEGIGSGRTVSDLDPDGTARWRRVVLSTSDLPLPDVLRRKKKDIPYGMADTVLDIPAQGRRHGLLDTLHGHSDPGSFRRSVSATLERHHGHLLPLFLDRLLADLEGATSDLDARIVEAGTHLVDHVAAAGGSNGTDMLPIALRLALIGHAGELAIRFGLLPWTPGDAARAAEQMAHARLSTPGHGGTGSDPALDAIRAFLRDRRDKIAPLYGRETSAPDGDVIGWRDEACIYVRSDCIRDGIEHFERLLGHLVETRVMIPGGEARSFQYRMPATKIADRPWVYRFDRRKIEGEA